MKVFEAEQACNDGATEIDMVINIGKVLGGDWDYVEKEIKAVTDVCHSGNAIVKVIFETDFVISVRKFGYFIYSFSLRELSVF